MPLVDLPPLVRALCHAARRGGGRALLVGGGVRDALRGEPTHDLDVEVHGIGVDELRAMLDRLGRVNEVGRSFGVFKLRQGDCEVDVSLPRRDSKSGPGHRGIQVTADPDLGIVEAARRRDLTINAIAYDPLHDELEDPFAGARDVELGVLRAVDESTFVEDPLRALRVVQFAARFGYALHPSLEALCRAMPLAELPPERVLGEVEKLLLMGRPPSRGWAVARATGAWRKVVPAWDTEVPTELDRVAAYDVQPPARRFALLLAAASAGEAGLLAALDQLNIFRWRGTDVRKLAVALARGRAAWQAARDDGALDTRARRIAEDVELELLSLLVDAPALREAAARLGILRAPLPQLLGGRDAAMLGVAPGRAVGEFLAGVREAQLTGEFTTRDDALAWAQARRR
ncbi:MAG: CCA tRNA nucleotidyltransferase [Deltaproteobacteria bacterium]|nr:CCA tRNA nucleotidyltransferase [Deltaproteobacteria bacterium]